MNYHSNAMGTNNAYTKYEGTVQTKYFYNNETLTIKCIYNTYSFKHDKSIKISPKFYGCFDKDGKLISFDSYDCEYSGFELTRAYTDYGTTYGLEYDRNQNITKAYLIDSLGKADASTIRTYEYTTKINYTNIDFLYNNSYEFDDKIICGTRGWSIIDENADEKLIKRELIRLEISLQDGINKYGADKEIIVFMHYPPISNAKIMNKEEIELVDIMKNG